MEVQAPNIGTVSKGHTLELKQESLSSEQIAEQLIRNTIGHQKVLQIFRKKKHKNYETFSKHIYKELKKSGFTFQMSYSIFQSLYCHFDLLLSGGQPKAILQGFVMYWKTLTLRYPQLKTIFVDRIFQFPSSITAPIVKFLQSRAQLEAITDIFIGDITFQVKQMVKQQNLRGSAFKETNIKILRLLSSTQCYNEFDVSTLLDLLISLSYNDVAFFFKTINKGKNKLNTSSPGPMEKQGEFDMVDQSESFIVDPKFAYDLTTAYVQECLKIRRIKDAESLIKHNHLQISRFPNLLRQQNLRYLEYIERTEKLHFIELLLSGGQGQMKQDFELLAHILVRKNRYKEAAFFIEKYKLQGCSAHKQMGKRQISFNRQRLITMKNVLIQKDRFGATQLRVFHQLKDFLELQDFGVYEQNVKFIDSQPEALLGLKSMHNSTTIGIDSQRFGGRHPFDPSKVVLAQVAICEGQKNRLKEIVIFDICKLSKSQKFKEEMTKLFTSYEGRIVGQDIKQDITGLLRVLGLKVDQKKFDKLKIEDTMHLFKKKFPKQARSSLDFIAEKLFKKTISKYQQCSGWRNRPLRKAQLHYAALDCYLPIKIIEKLTTTN